MTSEDVGASEETSPKPNGKKPLIAGVILAVLLGAAGFYAVWSGLVLGPEATSEEEVVPVEDPAMRPRVAFVPVDPLVISLGPDSSADHLRFEAQLEVEPAEADEVRAVMPRIVDVLNGYLRAVRPEQFEEPSSLIRLRSQMLRRVRIVAGEERVKDLLVMEFVLN